MISRITPSELAPMHTQAIISLLVMTAATRATRPTTARISETSSIDWPPTPSDGAGPTPSTQSPISFIPGIRRLLVLPVPAVTGVDRRRRTALAQLLEL